MAVMASVRVGFGMYAFEALTLRAAIFVVSNTYVFVKCLTAFIEVEGTFSWSVNSLRGVI